MKKLLALVLLFPSLVFAAANSMLLEQRNSTNNGNITRIVDFPATDGLFWYNTTTFLPSVVTLGTNLSITGGVLNAASSAQVNSDWTASSGVAQILNKPSFATVAFTGLYADLTGQPSLFSGAYGDLTGIPSTFTPSAHTHAAADIVSGTLADARIPSLAISKTTGLQSALDAKFNIPAGTTAQYVRGDGSLATFPTTAARVFQNPARSLNSAFQISATRDAAVVYTVDISVTSLLLAGASGRVYLEYADDSGFTTNVVTVNSSPNATGGVLNVTNLGSGNVSGWIPAGKYARIRTQNVASTPTFLFQGSQEVLQ